MTVCRWSRGAWSLDWDLTRTEDEKKKEKKRNENKQTK